MAKGFFFPKSQFELSHQFFCSRASCTKMAKINSLFQIPEGSIFPDFTKFLFPCQIYFLGFRGGHRNHQRPQITVLFPPSNRRTATTATARGRHAALKEDFFHNFFTQFLLTPSVIDFPIDRFSIIHRRNFQPFDLGTAVHQGFVNVGRDICFS